jgi:hypothetical protein
MPQNLAYAGHMARATRNLRTSMAEEMASSTVVIKRARFQWHTLVALYMTNNLQRMTLVNMKRNKGNGRHVCITSGLFSPME